MTRFLLFVGCCLFAFLTFAQTPISGIINDYTTISAINSCGNGLTVGDSQGFAIGSEVLIVQMKGAQIIETNTATFGNISNLNQAGHYELAKIVAISGNEVQLENTLIHNYQMNGRVQMVSCPQYTNAEVIAPLTPAPWNGQIGGILALKVTNEMTFSADIDLRNTGFRGGASTVVNDNNCSWTFNVTDYFYDSNNWRGSFKGEGIADFINNKEAGRGPQANGGGGGNDHNSGGGGGANGSDGGQGGENEEPSLFGCDGHFPGIGGRGLNPDTTQLFLGGGGGSGHTNNNLETDGGIGGGMAFILANKIIANNHSILASGESPDLNISQDGAGGAGAGGSIVLLGNEISGDLNIDLNGGTGGSISVNGSNRCMGPGGGGGGGRLLTNLVGNPMLSVSKNGGQSGLLINSSNSCNNSSLGATAGSNGTIESLFALPQSDMETIFITNQPTDQTACVGTSFTIATAAEGNNLTYQWQFNDGSGFQNLANGVNFQGAQTLNLMVVNAPSSIDDWQFRLVVNSVCFGSQTSDEILVSIQDVLQITNQPTSDQYCEGEQVAFQLVAEGVGLTYQWQVDIGSGFMDLMNGGIYSGAMSANLTVGPVNTMLNELVFRCIVEDDCGENVASNSVVLTVDPLPTAAFSFNTDGLEVTFDNLSMDGNSYTWNFGDNNSSNTFDPVHTFAQSGTYNVELTVLNDCGDDVVIVPITLLQGALPVANFTSDVTAACAPSLVQYINNSSGNASAYEWSFPGGNPSSSTLLNPLVSYPNSGSYTASLIAFNQFGSDTVLVSNYMVVNGLPSSDFSVSNVGNSFSFTNNSSNATTYQWVFGDGSTSMEANPTHTYTTGGIFVVTLTATNVCGSSDFALPVEALDQPIANFEATIQSGCAPLTVQFQDQSTNAVGSWGWTFTGGMPMTSTDPNPQIVYPNAGSFPVSLIVSNAVGNDEMTIGNYINVATVPTPGFSFNVNGNTVDFANLSNNATSYSWDFGDNNSSNLADPSHTFLSSGMYVVVLTAINSCGMESVTQTIEIEESFLVNFTSNFTEACAPFVFNFTDLSSSSANSWNWSFLGGTPASSNEQNPTVVYAEPGEYNVTLETSNGLQSNSLTIDNYLTLIESPLANFTYSLDGNTVTFTNNSTNATSYEWDFGDGTTSTEPNPMHEFVPGVYTVTLMADNGLCSSFLIETIDVNATATYELANGGKVRFYPNPTQDEVYISFEEGFSGAAELSLQSMSGQVIQNWTLQGENTFQLNLANWPVGIYILRLNHEGQQLVERLVKY